VAGAGVYILTIAPAESSEGRAQTNGLDPGNVACNTDATVEAVQFRLLPVDPTLYSGLDPGTDNFRNALAYRCFGDTIQPAWLSSLINPVAAAPNLLEAMRAVSLTDYDVPVALIYLTGRAQVNFIDTWAVRREIARADASGVFGALIGEHRTAVRHAALLQFQRQIADMATPAGDLGSATAQGQFAYLPAAGIIPVPEEIDTTDAQATRFFAGMTYRSPAFINAARLEWLLRESLYYPPIDPQSGELVWLYRVRENRVAIDFAESAGAPRSYVAFASGHIGYRADAQFDLARWNYSNYALQR